MNDNLNQLERELIFILKEEYSFYQSLFIMLDKQKDLLKYNKEDHLLELFAEIERSYKRIKKSEDKISTLKNKNPNIFRLAAALPEVKKIVNSIVTLVKKNVRLVQESEEYMNKKYQRIKSEIGGLKNSEKILQYMRDNEPSPQFVDGKQ
ncbi:MAG: hypothetical protein DRP35_07430 [Candidatus Zixiibacteriota bacterium]|nr:MAG: hypothetical protein DRP35_07430 [candidate division Zixibacteria bacterium]